MPKAMAAKHKPVVKKQCPRCKKRKLAKTSFYPDEANPTGYRTYCKDCVKAMNEQYKRASDGKGDGKGKGKGKGKA